ncbi:MAG TPA: hypothetical protein VI078_09495 [bacterium]
MSEQKQNASAAPGPAAGTPPPVKADQEPPATLGQKIFIVVLYLYVASLVWLVLSHHWYGVLPTWLDPH